MALRVLVVDDSSVMRSIISKSLRLSGIELESVREAKNGQEGLDAIAADPVDLALVDINMPVMTGDEMIKRLKAGPHAASVKVIVVSSDHTEARLEQLAAAGVPIIHKPFNPNQLRELIIQLTGAKYVDAAQEQSF
jgi:two-component system chemotaxis response regulator CheY